MWSPIGGKKRFLWLPWSAIFGTIPLPSNKRSLEMNEHRTVEAVERYATDVAAKLDHFWFDDTTLAINLNLDDTIPVPLRTSIELRLTLEEMRRALQRLGDECKHYPKPTPGWNYPKGLTIMWWDHGQLAVGPVPLCIYRDEHFSVHVPHHVGERLIDIMEERLAECESK
jgi:hypothetical protein